MTSAKINKHSHITSRARYKKYFIYIPVFFYLSILFTCLFLALISCQIGRIPIGNPFKSEPLTESESTGSGEESKISGGVLKENGNIGDLSLFDYTKIKIEPTESIDVKIKNCNLYLDIYGDILILGEIINASKINKTNIQITFNFYDKAGNEIDSKIIPAYVDYLMGKATVPFYLIYDDKYKYIDIAKVKIGVNYNNHKENFMGNPVITIESFHYREDMLVINGSVENIGQNKVEDLKLFLTLYDFKNKVVSIKQCFLSRDKLEQFEKEEFEVKVLIDEYLRNFTHYHAEIFFRDSLKV
ncbi:MAG: hypothetical protein FJW56_11010 [Actinobacteria bacterium]|nr:hypothetical protein [Actinomycetota bacterium]